jgi:hypothetical protein
MKTNFKGLDYYFYGIRKYDGFGRGGGGVFIL